MSRAVAPALAATPARSTGAASQAAASAVDRDPRARRHCSLSTRFRLGHRRDPEDHRRPRAHTGSAAGQVSRTRVVVPHPHAAGSLLRLPLSVGSRVTPEDVDAAAATLAMIMAKKVPPAPVHLRTAARIMFDGRITGPFDRRKGALGRSRQPTAGSKYERDAAPRACGAGARRRLVPVCLQDDYRYQPLTSFPPATSGR